MEDYDPYDFDDPEVQCKHCREWCESEWHYEKFHDCAGRRRERDRRITDMFDDETENGR